ncbi:uncharacterized protein LOC105201037 [Solenopsis invicta]|uniref:uncharacterized protein LOC105201037 n=1 Tax=Solenopsis invicta TaxID=13686 RepID=UPI0005961A79|nr:uncharacterized protein LOC105201037 [Solenopsis invicta]
MAENNKIEKARRRLFQEDGDEDNSQANQNDTNHYFEEERRIQAEEARKKWGFDFIRGVPDPQSDRFKWVKPNESFESEEINGNTNVQEERGNTEKIENKKDSNVTIEEN